MRCLWLTLADPEPRHNGQYVYSGGLIDSVAATGSEVEVLGLRRPESDRCNGARGEHVVWWLPGEPLAARHSRWGSLASRLPHIAYRCNTAAMRRELDGLLRRGGWDGIVFDGISVGWALPQVLAHYAGRGDRPRLIYVSHNHEESLRCQVAENQPQFFKRQAVRFDALKIARLERELVDQVDYVTAITPEDLSLYRQRRDKPMGVVTPGYRGRRLKERRISSSLPRRAVIVGSFDWIAKRMNLEEFVDVADPLFATARRRPASPAPCRTSRATWTRRASPSCPSATAAASSSRCWNMSSTASRCSRSPAPSRVFRCATTTASCSSPITPPSPTGSSRRSTTWTA